LILEKNVPIQMTGQTDNRLLAPRSKFVEVSGSKGHEAGQATLVDLVMTTVAQWRCTVAVPD